MLQPRSVANREQVVDTMIGLTRLSHLQRAIVAGSDSLELYLALRRRGFSRHRKSRRAAAVSHKRVIKAGWVAAPPLVRAFLSFSYFAPRPSLSHSYGVPGTSWALRGRPPWPQ